MRVADRGVVVVKVRKVGRAVVVVVDGAFGSTAVAARRRVGGENRWRSIVPTMMGEIGQDGR